MTSFVAVSAAAELAVKACAYSEAPSRPKKRSHLRGQGQGALGAAALPLAAAIRQRRHRRLQQRVPWRLVRLAAPGEDGEEEQNPIKSAIAFISGVVSWLMGMLNDSQTSQSTTETRSESEEGGASLVQQLGRTPIDAQKGLPIYSLGPFPRCTEASDLRSRARHVTVITTAALPWTTGPSINPLLRSLHLARNGHRVIFVMPWVRLKEQGILFPEGVSFHSTEEQERYVAKWCRDRAGMDPAKLPITFRWYEASYVEAVRSIFPSGDNAEVLADCEKDVLVLEEPEHLCWYHNGPRWTELYRHVIGVVHTNYQAYLEKMEYEGLMSSATIRDSLFSTFTTMVCSAYCDVTIKLSSAGMSLPNEVKYNVHGVRKEFFEGARRADVKRKRLRLKPQKSANQVYFIGKAVKPKGWVRLIKLLGKLPAGEGWAEFAVDGFGSGADAEEIQAMVQTLNEERKTDHPVMNMSAGLDHADKHFDQYKVLLNPSTTEMLCTVTAEALALGKRVVLPDHSSNAYFKANFADRCHFFDLQELGSFEAALQAALGAEGPTPLPAEAEEKLRWQTASERFYDASQVHVLSGRLSRPSEARGAKLAYELHSRFQTDTPAMSAALKSATLKESGSWDTVLESGPGSDLLARLKRFTMLEQTTDFDVLP